MIVFVAKYLECYLVRAGTIATLSKHTSISMILDALDEIFGVVVILLIVDAVSERVLFISTNILGSVTATGCVSERWPKFVWKWLKPPSKKKPLQQKFTLTRWFFKRK